MGALIDKKWLIKKSMLLLSTLCCIIGLAFNGAAMGTDSWIVSTACPEKANVVNNTACFEKTAEINYGLFHGVKSLSTEGQTPTDYALTVFCPSSDGLCIFSCGRDDKERIMEYDFLRNGIGSFECKSGKGQVLSNRAENVTEPRDEEQFLEKGYWIATIVFLSLTLAFQLIAAALSGLNCAERVPIEVWFGPLGIYIANGATGLTSLITLSLWGGEYDRRLKNELAVRETIRNEMEVTSSSLGFSYWLVFGSLLTVLASCVLVRFRNVPKNRMTSTDKEEDSNPTAGVFMF